MILKNFVVFEGLDGTGTTSQLRLLQEAFTARGRQDAVHFTCEPTGDSIGKLIREALSGAAGFDAKTIAYLFGADRCEHIYGKEGILEQLKAGKAVFSDRYLFSSLAYQGLAAGKELAQAINAPFPLPEYLFFFDLPAKTAMERIGKRNIPREIYEKEAFQQKVADEYHAIFRYYAETAPDMRIIRIDAAQTIAKNSRKHLEHCLQFADSIKDEKAFLLIRSVTFFSFAQTAMLPAYFVTYKEQYYKLYHIHYQQYPDDTLENIYWLEKAINADFCNPLYALGKINDRTDWEKYRYLFMMHLNLKMVEQHLRLGMKYDKQVAYFYNAPWKEQNIESLKMAEDCYNTALFYWKEATLWAEKANVRKFQFLFLTDLQYWEDERERIAQKKLNYERTITRELERLAKVRAEFMQMEDTY